MDEPDFELRNVTYRLFVELGRAPTADKVGRAAGLTPDVPCALARAVGDRRLPEWRPHTRDQNQALLDRLRLTGDFWRFP